MNIELKGFGGHAWRVCDTCPCSRTDEDGCRLGYTQIEGQMHLATGKVSPGEDRDKTVPSGYYYVTIRPQECIDKHGK